MNNKRLIEVPFPLKQVSLDSVHEKNMRNTGSFQSIRGDRESLLWNGHYQITCQNSTHQ